MNILTDQEKAICHCLMISEADFIASKIEDLQLALQRENNITETEAKEKVMKLMGISPAEAKKREAVEAKRAEAHEPLSDEELKVCRSLGVEPLEYQQAKLEEAGISVKI